VPTGSLFHAMVCIYASECGLRPRGTRFDDACPAADLPRERIRTSILGAVPEYVRFMELHAHRQNGGVE
jgi:hypothetical protein